MKRISVLLGIVMIALSVSGVAMGMEGESEKSGVHEKGRETGVAHQKVPRYCPVRYGHAFLIQALLRNAMPTWKLMLYQAEKSDSPSVIEVR